MKFELELTQDQVSDIVRKDLMMYYAMRVEPIGEEDQADQQALLRVIELYSTPEQYEQFLEEIKDES
jgi:hypothetical protein